MGYLSYIMSLFLITAFAFSSVFAQRVYRQSRVQNGKVITDYYYPYLPGSPSKGRPYREGGKIKYERSSSTQYYSPYANPRDRSYYDRDNRDYDRSYYERGNRDYDRSYYDRGSRVYEREGRAYRDKSGKIQHEKEYTRYPTYRSRY